MPQIFRFTLTADEFDRLLALLEDHPDDPLVLRLQARKLIAKSRRLEGDRAQPAPVTETRTENQTGVT